MLVTFKDYSKRLNRTVDVEAVLCQVVKPDYRYDTWRGEGLRVKKGPCVSCLGYTPYTYKVISDAIGPR